MFRSPVLDVTATLAPGTSVGLDPGTEVLTGEGSVTTPATIGAGPSAARISGRVASIATTLAGTNVNVVLSPSPPTARRCIVSKLTMSCTVAGLQTWSVVGRDPSTLVVDTQVTLLVADLSKAPLVIDFAGGLPLDLGDYLTLAVPALAGTYVLHVVFDQIFV